MNDSVTRTFCPSTKALTYFSPFVVLILAVSQNYLMWEANIVGFTVSAYLREVAFKNFTMSVSSSLIDSASRTTTLLCCFAQVRTHSMNYGLGKLGIIDFERNKVLGFVITSICDVRKPI